MKVLIADDHIPDENIPDNGIKQYLKQRYPSNKDSELMERVDFMRSMVKRLRASGFDIQICNRVSHVKGLIQNNKYDAAIVDLGWYADHKVLKSERPDKGWDIINTIREKSPSLPIVMYSHRLYEDVAIPLRAADAGVLPVYKYFEDACVDNVIAILQFVYSTREQVRKIDTKAYKDISTITTVLMGVALVFVVVGLSMLLFNKTEEGQLTAGVSLLASAMSGMFWKYLSDVRKNILS